MMPWITMWHKLSSIGFGRLDCLSNMDHLCDWGWTATAPQLHAMHVIAAWAFRDDITPSHHLSNYLWKQSTALCPSEGYHMWVLKASIGNRFTLFFHPSPVVYNYLSIVNSMHQLALRVKMKCPIPPGMEQHVYQPWNSTAPINTVTLEVYSLM